VFEVVRAQELRTGGGNGLAPDMDPPSRGQQRTVAVRPKDVGRSRLGFEMHGEFGRDRSRQGCPWTAGRIWSWVGPPGLGRGPGRHC